MNTNGLEINKMSGRPAPVDRETSRRPGVPMLTKPGAAGGTTGVIPQQEQTVPVLVGVEVFRLTPIFGTAVPPRGLSGVVRRSAYKIPEHKGGRWMMLILADRIDVWEGRIARHPFLTTLVLAAVGGGIWWRNDRSRRRATLRWLAR